MTEQQRTNRDIARDRQLKRLLYLLPRDEPPLWAQQRLKSIRLRYGTAAVALREGGNV